MRLNHLGLCMSPKTLNKILDEIGKDHSLHLVQQKEQISRYLKKVKEHTAKLTSLDHNLNDLQNQVLKSGASKDMLESTKQELHNLKGEIEKLERSRPPSYSIDLDNCDIVITVSDMTSDNQNKDHHWCNHNAVIDRVNPLACCDDKPIADILDLPNAAILPSIEDQEALIRDLVVIVSRVFVENFESFEIFKDIVPSQTLG